MSKHVDFLCRVEHRGYRISVVVEAFKCRTHVRRELPDDVSVLVPPEPFGAPLVQVLRQARARDRQSHTAELLERAGEVPRLAIGVPIYIYVCVLVSTAITAIATVHISALPSAFASE